ncbi:type II toxin-antitoxin system RelE/ParE family toxin [Serratia liquefaciens]|uniref:type II toxin-antitoxin system RelE/ParE family toxin n=1 Tax=Serratia liquefaciens TaxID=614 RepID=UPI0021574484|nr:type II toxin-antitoxin system RelE/ParE family toxin [Serratia liquefaciens]
MWEVDNSDVFDKWFKAQSVELQDEVLAVMQVLSEFGPNLGRPYVDTLHGSKYTNMKELRIQFEGDPIRAFFAFDPERKAIILCAGDKTGLNEKRFYKDMIKLADEEYSKHLKNLKKG